jgi:hypothetical protein
VVALSLDTPVVNLTLKEFNLRFKVSNLSGLLSKLTDAVDGFVLETLVLFSQGTALVA